MITPDVTTSSSSSSLFIPHEILGEILSHCDPSTLAVASRVSSACLELASPFLYTDIVVKDLASIISLFRLSPSLGAALPKSDRVTTYLSLSLLYSITVHLESPHVDLDPLRNLEHPPALAVPVFVVSMPGMELSVRSRRYDLSAFADLVNPHTLIVQGRQSDLGGTRYDPPGVSFRQNRFTTANLSWDRLHVVLLNEATVDLSELLEGREPASSSALSLARAVPPPLRLTLDYGSIPEKQFAGSERAQHFVFLDLINSFEAERGFSLEVWVDSKRMKQTLEDGMKASQQGHIGPARRERGQVKVASERVLRFRDDLALGARKEMDWAVLNEV